jgi:hypothetical protein
MGYLKFAKAETPAPFVTDYENSHNPDPEQQGPLKV